MLDNDARRTLEEEAIALVNLSNGRMMAQENAEMPILHPLVRVDANLLAQRDADNDKSNGVSMSVFVNASGNVSMVPISKASPDHHGGFDMASVNMVSKQDACMKKENVIMTMDPTVSKSAVTSPTGSLSDDKLISMQSLMSTLHKRKHPDGESNDDRSAPKLPRFRDVFESPRRLELPPVAPPTVSMNIPTQQPPVYSTPPHAPREDPPQAPPPQPAPEAAYPPGVSPPPELKCKYRTGKCNNARALKSCGDYHNLCNYHRLRANANQRKLDRKKKVQRQASTPTTHVPINVAAVLGLVSTSTVTSPITAPAVTTSDTTVPPATAAAVALASLPSAFMMPQQPYLPYLVPPSAGSQSSTATSGPAYSNQAPLRPKEENAC